MIEDLSVVSDIRGDHRGLEWEDDTAA